TEGHSMVDLIVRDGLIHDGSGLSAYRADVAVDGGRVVGIGRFGGKAERVIDADGLAVAPGFIDVHTHLDAQLSWDHQAVPMLEHGVTTVVTGNCSLSLAPLRSGQRERLARMFEQIEQVPYDALDRGIDWAWEDFPQWLAYLEPRLGINLAPLVGHSALRMWIMGAAAHERAASEEEITAMQRCLAAALDAGAAGLSISHIDVDERRQPVPSRLADPAELQRLGVTLGAAGGMLQSVPEFWDTGAMLRRVDELATLSVTSGCPTTFSPLIDQTPGLVDEVLAGVEEAWRRGARVFAQVQARRLDLNFRLCESGFAFARLRPWRQIMALADRGEQLARFRDPATRRELVDTAYLAADAKSRASLEASWVSAVVNRANEALVGRTLGDIAAARRGNPAEVMLDIALDEQLETRFTRPATSNTDADLLARLIRHPAVLIGASDAGAHVRSFSTYGDTGCLFRDFVRSRQTISVEQAVKCLTANQSRAWGLGDRGQLAAGSPADIVVFDPKTIDVGPDMDVTDLPAGGRRYLRHSVGVEATIVNGGLAWSAEEGYLPQRGGQVVGRPTAQ
ncbi:MAG TPA: amidohydrolase family protein, partial [Acidimicrobiales bacterium]